MALFGCTRKEDMPAKAHAALDEGDAGPRFDDQHHVLASGSSPLETKQ